jgi:hypothetical protein
LKGQVSDRPNILKIKRFRHRLLGAADLPRIVDEITRYGSRGYIMFSSSQERTARILQLTPPGAMRALERAMSQSPRFRLWYANRDVRIYEVTGQRRG